MLPYYKLVRTLAFPSMPRIIALLLSVDLIGCMLAFAFASPTLEAAGRGLLFGFLVLFMPSILTDKISAALLLKDDPLFYLRRCLALSLFSCVMWTIVLCLGGIMNAFVRINFPQQPFYLALFTVLPLRSLAVLSMSSKKMSNKIVFSFLQPLVSSFAATLLFNPDMTVLAKVLSVATILSLAPSILLLRSIELNGREVIRASPLRIFRAFLVDWLNRKNEMFEKFLEEIGAKSTVEVTLIQFNSRKSSKPKGLLVVSDFHPGPFLNVGSSPLPYLIQKSLEEENGLIVAVPHGVSGHELNLVSQAQNQGVLSVIRSLMQDYDVSEGGSTFKRFEVGSAKVGAQILGKCLLLTLTQSPKDMEDIPFSFGKELENTARKRFKHVAIVDSHNCISEARMFTEEEIANLRLAASEAIESSQGSPLVTLELGAARGVFGFGPEQGGGPGGISTLVIRASDQLTAYMTVDANNMASGLREKILISLKEVDVSGGEVMTTDTHIVNGLVPARLGYYPLGEAINQDAIIKLVRHTVEKAKENLEEVKVLTSSGSVEVKSLGSESLEKLMSFMYRVAKLVAKYMLILFLMSSIVGVALLSWRG